MVVQQEVSLSGPVADIPILRVNERNNGDGAGQIAARLVGGPRDPVWLNPNK